VVGRGGGGSGTGMDADASGTEDPEPQISPVSSTAGGAGGSTVCSGDGSSYAATPEPTELV